MTTGERIQAARLKAGMKQSDLAEKIGVATITIGQYERGKRQPRMVQLERIAFALETTLSELVGPGYWSTVPKDEVAESWESNVPFYVRPESRVENAMKLMNKEGRRKVADYAEDILPRYRATPRQAAAEPSPAPPPADTADTTPATPPPETP